MTPLTLYKGPIFKAMVTHACQRCDHILIMSAKFGLLRLDDPVSYYDTYLPDLSPQMREHLKVQVRAQIAEGIPQALRKPWAARRVLSYLPEAYYQFLLEAAPGPVGTWSRPYKGLAMFGLINCLSAEIAGYGSSYARR